MKLGTWLLGLVSPMISKILIALGFSVVSIVGVQSALGSLKTMLINSIYGLPADLIQLFLLGGGGTGLGIIFGAYATRIALWAITSSTKIIGTNQQ